MDFMSPRINRVLVSGVDSKVIPVNQYMRNTIVQIGVSGTATWRVRWTAANVMRGEAPVWADPPSGEATGTETGVVTFSTPVRALLIEITSGDGAITAYIGQQAKGGFGAAAAGGDGPDLTNLHSLLRFETDITTDDTGRVWSVTDGPLTINAALAAEGAQSADFSASNAYMRTAPAVGSFAGDFCVEMWFYPTDLAAFSSLFRLVRGGSIGNTNPDTLMFFLYASGTSVLPSWNNSIVQAAALTLNEWNHIAMTREGADIKLYINGVLHRESTALYGNDYSAYHTLVHLGFDVSTTAARTKGMVDFFRVTDGSARYTAAFTPPTEA